MEASEFELDFKSGKICNNGKQAVIQIGFFFCGSQIDEIDIVNSTIM